MGQRDFWAAVVGAIAGLVVAAGAVAPWRQVQVNRYGQITDRFTHAIDQVGDATLSVPDPHPTPEVDLGMPWLHDRAPDVLSALIMLGRRSYVAGDPGIGLRRVDLRRSNLERTAWREVDFNNTDLRMIVLRQAVLDGSHFTGADLSVEIRTDAATVRSGVRSCDGCGQLSAGSVVVPVSKNRMRRTIWAACWA